MTSAKLPWYFDMYLHTSIPAWALVCIACLAFVGVCWKWKSRYRVLLGAYAVLVLCHTVVFRGSSPEWQISLMPFKNYHAAFVEHDLELMGEILMNVFLFVPVGLLCALLGKNFRWYHALLLASSLSLIIELLQLFLRRGLCETDDVIHNSLGAIAAFFMVRSVRIFITDSDWR